MAVIHAKPTISSAGAGMVGRQLGAGFVSAIQSAPVRDPGLTRLAPERLPVVPAEIRPATAVVRSSPGPHEASLTPSTALANRSKHVINTKPNPVIPPKAVPVVTQAGKPAIAKTPQTIVTKPASLPPMDADSPDEAVLFNADAFIAPVTNGFVASSQTPRLPDIRTFGAAVLSGTRASFASQTPRMASSGGHTNRVPMTDKLASALSRSIKTCRCR